MYYLSKVLEKCISYEPIKVYKNMLSHTLPDPHTVHTDVYMHIISKIQMQKLSHTHKHNTPTCAKYR